MRAVALHPDVIVVTSRVWQTTCTIVRGPAAEQPRETEAFVIDSPVYPEELELLPALLEQAQFPFSGLLATHGDWDHLLGRLAFPDAALGCAESTATRLGRELGAAQRRLREFDDEHYVSQRPLALGELQGLPVPGRLDVGERELELHEATGHTPDGMAIWAPWPRVLIAGDYLSPVEIPSLSPDGSLEEYTATLQRLEPLAAAAEYVIPGHGAPQTSERALQILAEDLAYLEDLAADGDRAQLPRAAKSPSQRSVHADNVRVLGA